MPARKATRRASTSSVKRTKARVARIKRGTGKVAGSAGRRRTRSKRGAAAAAFRRKRTTSAASRRTTSKRTTLTNASGTHYIRRRADGTIKSEVSKGRSLAQDRSRRAKRTAQPGQGDRGDSAR